MKCRYQIEYNLEKDIWNWYYGSKYSNNGEQLDDVVDREMSERIKQLHKGRAEKKLLPFLTQKRNEANSELNSFIKIAEREFKDKFAAACEILEKITRRPMIDGEFTFYITTFPRMVVFFDENIIFTYAKIDNKLWGMPIDGFLHEGLHFQFEHYFRRDKNSPVSKLSEDDYFMLKESLTVILDEELKPIITLPDNSYPEFAEFRKVLHENWKKYHDFNRLVSFGLQSLPDFASK